MKWIKCEIILPSIVMLMFLIGICVYLCSYYSMPRVHVGGYYRQDGTYVSSYYRRYPGQGNVSEQVYEFLSFLRLLKLSISAFWWILVIYNEKKVIKKYGREKALKEYGGTENERMFFLIFMFSSPIISLW